MKMAPYSLSSAARLGDRNFSPRWNRPVAQLLLALVALHCCGCLQPSAALVPNYYLFTCPNVESIVRGVMANAVARETRMAASILRLFFHDCFVNGCEGSLLLKDTATFTGEQSATPNVNSARGFNVIDDIKNAVEKACPNTVSCADILAIASRDGVGLVGGPFWPVLLGRRDGTSASQSAANNGIPSPFSNIGTLMSMFRNLGLSTQDLVALSGSHTIGNGHCGVVDGPGANSRLYNFLGSGQADPNVDPSFLSSLKSQCPLGRSNNPLLVLDTQTSGTFDNAYFKNLVAKKGLLNSDEELYYASGATQIWVQTFANSQAAFFSAFSTAMVKMGNIGVLQGFSGEIRKQCGFVN